VRGLDEAGQTSPMQQSPSVRHGALVEPHVGGGVHDPFTHESDELQQWTVLEQAPPVAPQLAGGVQTVVPVWVGSMHDSAPLQQGTVPEQAAFVGAQLGDAVQMLPVQESAPLQHGMPGGEQVAPVPAQTAGAVQTVGDPVQVSAELQQSALVAHVTPVPAQLAGRVHTLLPAGPAQAPAPERQQSASAMHELPIPPQDVAAWHWFPAQTSVAVQQGRLASQERPVAAQVGAAGGATHVPDEHTSVPQQASVAQEAPCAAHV